MAYGFHRLRHDVGKAAVDVNPPSVAESPCRRVAESPSCRVAVSPCRRVAVSPCRRVAVSPCRRVAVSPSRRIAVSPPELTAFPNSSIYPTAFAGQLTPQP
jgi:hypothetical protein